MIDWWWIVQLEKPVCWIATINSDPYQGALSSFDMTLKSQMIGREVISATEEMSPLQTQLYRLVYGSCP